ncbi:MAG TPA: FG-GAP-like repeat-containing protein [Cyclobacteriaceae bacterium]|nr:FG-GAP-like repeat-containing protein [Cyclobacteriaceae bacterium]
MKPLFRRASLHIAVLILLSMNASAQWTQLPGITGGAVTEVATTNGITLVGTLVGVFKSSDAGLSWEPMPITALAVQPAIASISIINGVWYVGTMDRGVYFSSDNGATWSQPVSGMDNMQVNRVVALDTALFAATSSFGILESVDQGQNWFHVDTFFMADEIRDIALDGQRLFVATAAGVFYSDDVSLGFSFSMGLPTNDFLSVHATDNALFAGSWGSGVFKSTDHGDSWTEVNNGLSFDASTMIESISHSGGRIFVTTNDQGVYVSDDAGLSWQLRSDGVEVAGCPAVVIVGTVAITGTANGIFRSTNDLQTWSPANTGFFASQIKSMVAIKDALYVSAGGLQRSDKFGVNWTKLLAQNVSTVAARGDSLFVGMNAFTRFAFSPDGGVNWVFPANNGLPFAEINSFAFHGSKIFAATFSGLFVTTDQGETWTSLSDSFVSPAIAEVVMLQGVLYAVVSGSGHYQSTDDGLTWNYNPILAGISVNHLNKLDDFYFASTADRGVRFSQDGGNFGTASYGMNDLNITAMIITGKDIIVGSVFGEVSYSPNWGANWYPIGERVPGPVMSLVRMGNTIVAGTAGRGVFRNEMPTLATTTAFIKKIPNGAEPLLVAKNLWIDFDNDGDLDFLIEGQTLQNDLSTYLFENTGSGSFRKALSPFDNLVQIANSDIIPYNSNQDARPDFLMLGQGSVQSSVVYNNLTTGFQNLGPLPQYQPSGFENMVAGDINNDGTTDLIVFGANGSPNGYPVVYLRKNGAFVHTVDTTIVSIQNAGAQLVDLDNDRDLDLVLSGLLNLTQEMYTAVYWNDGKGHFSEAMKFTGVQNSSVDVIDYDGDHDMDILYTGPGFIDYIPVIKLLKNNNGTFEEVALDATVRGSFQGSVRWGDYNNDGRPDILVQGWTYPSPAGMSVYTNMGNDQFQLVNQLLDITSVGTASWGDADNDGDLDILYSGDSFLEGHFAGQMAILENVASVHPNQRPAGPAQIQVTPAPNGEFQISWSAATDDTTPIQSLTYNLMVRNAATGEFLIHPFANASTGVRQVAAIGNVGLNTSWVLRDLPPGQYTVNVQAIDNAFAGSTWSPAATIANGGSIPNAPTALTLRVKKKVATLKWKDNSTNESGFVIERKSKSGVFVAIDTVNANVTVYTQSNVNGNLAYRVYAFNSTGRSAYSNVVTRGEDEKDDEDDEDSDKITCYPNPVRNTLNISVPGWKNSMLPVILLSNSGNVIADLLLMVDASGQTSVDVSGLHQGPFYVKVQMGTTSKVIRMVKN